MFMIFQASSSVSKAITASNMNFQFEIRNNKLYSSASGYVSKNGCKWDSNPCLQQPVMYKVCLKSNGTGHINVLFYLTSKFYNLLPSK